MEKYGKVKIKMRDTGFLAFKTQMRYEGNKGKKEGMRDQS